MEAGPVLEFMRGATPAEENGPEDAAVSMELESDWVTIRVESNEQDYDEGTVNSAVDLNDCADQTLNVDPLVGEKFEDVSRSASIDGDGRE